MPDKTTNPDLSEDEQRVLASVLDELVPPSDDGKMPGACQLGLVGYIDAALQKTPELRAMIVQGLADLDASARGRGAPSFAALSRDDKLRLLNEWGFVLPLTLHTYTGYYQHPRVIAALGLEPRPPHPEGYKMEPNDPTLLDAVRRRPKLYRDVVRS